MPTFSKTRIKPKQRDSGGRVEKSGGESGPDLTAVTAKTYVAFLERLDAPSEPSERLRRTMQTPAPWDKP